MKFVAQKDKERWDDLNKSLDFKIGDRVPLTHEGRYGLEPIYKGPFVVVKKTDVDTYLLETMEGQSFSGFIHVDRLIPAHGDNITTTWYDPTASHRDWRQTINAQLNMEHVDKINNHPPPTLLPTAPIDPQVNRDVQVSTGDNVGIRINP
ncbi:hypothetical protein BC941DRAFT_476519 [Chlamydoabsidia padenii]|nr:hypothetical protein BC941DRAFT_476519 [Chlamydoabsidia padenii]